jgi:hypothetical protein
MLRPPSSHAHRPLVRSSLGREIGRAAIAVLALAGLFATAFGIAADWRLSSLSNPAQTAAKTPPGDDNLSSGSMIFVPDVGDECRQSEIDNATWRVRSIGTVPCHEALAPKFRGHSASPTRIDVIRDSFRKAPH